MDSLRTGAVRSPWKALALGLVFTSGCTWQEWMDQVTFKDQFRQQFAPLNPEEENIAQVDVATIKWRRGDQQLEHDLWTELDEQFINLEQRRQFARHGLRYGLMRSASGSRLQATITNPVNGAEYRKNHPDAATRVFTAINDQRVPLAPAREACTVEARRVIARTEHELFWPAGPKTGPTRLLVSDAERGEAVRSVGQLELGYSVRLQKLPEGQTLVRLTPVAKYNQAGEAEWSDAFLDALRTKKTLLKNEVRFEPLAVDVLLGHDQYLIITSQPSEQPDAETWGDLAFVNHESDEQTVLVIRGASVPANRSPDPPKKGQAWPLAWQTAEVTLAGAAAADRK